MISILSCGNELCNLDLASVKVLSSLLVSSIDHFMTSLEPQLLWAIRDEVIFEVSMAMFMTGFNISTKALKLSLS